MGSVAEQTDTGASWVRDARTAAFARFKERGFPTVRDEDWRETNVAELARTSFARPETLAEPERSRLETLGVADLGGPEIVFVNGRYAPGLTRLRDAGPVVQRLRDVLVHDPARLETSLTRLATGDRNAFACLNTAFLEDGVVIDVPAGRHIAEPIQLVWVSTGSGANPTVTYPRALVLAGRGSEATLVETYVGDAGFRSLTNAVTEVRLDEGAGLTHVKVQREGDAAYHVGTIAVVQGRNSRFASHNFALGAALARTDIDQRFEGEGAETALYGLFVGRAGQLLDTHSRIDHATPRCSSRELYKGILDGRSRGVFHGRITVRKDAQKTDAQQSNPNLLLSREALVHSTPQLEILADDVKCKHGSTIGQLDPTALFYLRSRGIGEDEAKGLLTWAFANDVVKRVPIPALRASLEATLGTLLPGGPDRTEAT
jgi:Fe-S cluster assembly protein SufD